MNENLGNVIGNKIKELGIVNIIVIFVFIIALIYFIIASVGYYAKQLFSGPETVISYDYQNSENYSIDSENEEYKLTKVLTYRIFYNLEDICKAIILNLNNGNYDAVYSILDKNYINQLGEKNDVISKLTKFAGDNIDYEVTKVDYLLLDEAYNIDNSNIYFCYLNNKSGEKVKLVLDVDFTQKNYRILFIEM